MERAIEFEARRQIELIEDGAQVAQETRLYDPERDQTRSMRSKEDAQDYRYFPDPDLLPLVLGEPELARLGAQLPELPAARRERFVRDYRLPVYDAGALTASRASADYFEALVKASGVDGKTCANWQSGELGAALNQDNLDIASSRVGAQALAGLLGRIADGTVSGKLAKEVFAAMWAGEGSADDIIEKRALRQMSDAGAIETLVDEVLAANAKQVQDYRAGKEKAFNALVGQVMKASKGKANPAQVNELLKKKLSATG
jgi:aspartyl-tRNA(Asn)/glutamyl-tRNA(Gln) amidotransferase subunit B